jgi:hypothetical protein
MDPANVMFIARLALAVLLYGFLAALFWLLWRDLRATARTQEARTQKLGRLVVMESDAPTVSAGATFPLLPVSSLGRAPTNTITLPDEACSLEHALLYYRENQWWLEDLDSRNGTRLNEAAITAPTPVLPGDVIGIGRVKLKIEME